MMQKIDYKELMDKADIYYAALKAKRGLDLACTAPEAMPRIGSDQIRALAKALVEIINRDMSLHG